MHRAYLDYNATAPMRREAREAMIEAFDLVGNPSSVHAEGRAAKAIVERARAQVSEALGAAGADVIFVSGATEAAALALSGRGFVGAAIEHDAVQAWIDPSLTVSTDGLIALDTPEKSVLQLANSETGVVQDLPNGLAVSDVSQGFGRLPFAYSWAGVKVVFLAAHKCGGPKGIGAVVVPQGYDMAAQIRGGGQEMGRRAGTENIAAIAGFGAAAIAAVRDLAEGVWLRVGRLRDQMEAEIASFCPEVLVAGQAATRLSNTSCIVTPGWKGESQVMAMDLAGYAISSGSACSSGKVRASKALMAMGYSREDAASAVRVSLGPETTEAEVMGFARTWGEKYKRLRSRAA